MFTKNALRSLAAVALVSVALVGCQPAGPAGLTEEDLAAIRTANQTWATAANAKDFDTLAGLYAEDAKLLPTGFPMVDGRAAIKDFFAGFPPFENMQTQHTEVQGVGDMAYAMGTYSMTLNLPFAPAPIQDRGKFIEIWRKQADGSWKISRDIYNSDLGGGGAEESTTP